MYNNTKLNNKNNNKKYNSIIKYEKLLKAYSINVINKL